MNGSDVESLTNNAEPGCSSHSAASTGEFLHDNEDEDENENQEEDEEEDGSVISKVKSSICTM